MVQFLGDSYICCVAGKFQAVIEGSNLVFITICVSVNDAGEAFAVKAVGTVLYGNNSTASVRRAILAVRTGGTADNFNSTRRTVFSVSAFFTNGDIVAQFQVIRFLAVCFGQAEFQVARTDVFTSLSFCAVYGDDCVFTVYRGRGVGNGLGQLTFIDGIGIIDAGSDVGNLLAAIVEAASG